MTTSDDETNTITDILLNNVTHHGECYHHIDYLVFNSSRVYIYICMCINICMVIISNDHLTSKVLLYLPRESLRDTCTKLYIFRNCHYCR